RDPDNVSWLSQTTLSVDETNQTVDALRKKFPNLLDPPSDDICYATSNRQDAVKAMAPECELVIVVGSDNSSNSVRLVEVAIEADSNAAHLFYNTLQMDEVWLEGSSSGGVNSGASDPDMLVRDLLERIAVYGFYDEEDVWTAALQLKFSLLRELSYDLIDET